MIEDKKTCNCIGTLVAAAFIALLLAGCTPQFQSTQEAASSSSEKAMVLSSSSSSSMTADFKKKSYTDDEALDEVLNSIDLETLAAEDELQVSLDEFFAACGDSHEGYMQNEQMLGNWYAFAEERSAALYSAIENKCETFNSLLLSDPKYASYKTWNDALSECYDVWNDALSDYYEFWNDLYSDIYRECDGMLSSISVTDYDSYRKSWDNMYEKRQESWYNMYDLRQDAWDSLYDARQETWDELYDRM